MPLDDRPVRIRLADSPEERTAGAGILAFWIDQESFGHAAFQATRLKDEAAPPAKPLASGISLVGFCLPVLTPGVLS
jgi:hypothetical protein